MGSDGNDGSTPERAYASIQRAIDTARPGDRIVVSASGGYGYTHAYDVHGTPGAWVSIEAANDAHRPVIDVRPFPGCDGFDVQRSSYVGLYGFEVVGDPDGPDPDPSGVGVFRGAHHVAVWCLDVHDFPGGGINCFYAPATTYDGHRLPAGGWDCVDVWFPVIHGCCGRSPSNTSGVSFYGAEDLTGGGTLDGTYGYRLVGPYIYDCACTEPFAASGLPGSAGLDFVTDGNGISVDSLVAPHHGQAPYTKAGLVESPLVVGCGGRAVHVFDSVNLRCMHATAVGNLRTPSPAITGGAELDSTVEDGRVTFSGCVILPRPESRAIDAVSRHEGCVILGGHGDAGSANVDRREQGESYLAGDGLAAGYRDGLDPGLFAPRAADLVPADPAALGYQVAALGRRPNGMWAAGAVEPVAGDDAIGSG